VTRRKTRHPDMGDNQNVNMIGSSLDLIVETNH